MNKFSLFLILLTNSLTLTSQGFTYEELAPMPERVSNNAVTEAFVNGDSYVYSFAGIDSTHLFSGIHLKAYKYNVADNQWSSLPPLPDMQGKIAAGASFVNGKIYIIGGYYVNSNLSELSSNKVHVFDPVTDTYLPDAAPIPVAIDDHVQAVFEDSLIYVITGWSNTTNVRDVQIFNPQTNSWSAGTPIPNISNYKVFGGSGTIIGHTIYYTGGARSSFNFPLTTYLIKGEINPTDPTDITWSHSELQQTPGYRMAASFVGQSPLWFGGTTTSYNFDGLAYTNNNPAPPLGQALWLDFGLDSLITENNVIPSIMDYRGLGKINSNTFILAGGMEAGPTTTNRTIKVSVNLSPSSSDYVIQPTYKVYPNPASDYIKISGIDHGKFSIYSVSGELIIEGHFNSFSSIDIKPLSCGPYILRIEGENGSFIQPLILKQ